MTRKPVRTQVAVATTTVGIAVLLAGPVTTFGLGVPSTGDVSGTTTQVTGTVQNVVDTTQQTAAGTVTNVESTVQTTVQQTTEAVAPQAAPAPAPATQTQTQASAPDAAKQVATRVAAPVKKHVSAVSRPRMQGKPAAAPVRLAQKAGGATVGSVRVAKTKHTRAGRSQRVAAPGLTTSAQDTAPVSCDVPALAALPGGAELQALLAIVCDAANGLDLPTRIGLVQPDAGPVAPALGEVHGASARGTAGAPVATSSALRGTHRTPLRGAGRPAGSAASSQPGAPIGGPTGALAVGHGRGLGYIGAVPVAHISPSSTGGAEASKSAGHHHHGWFSGQSRGTEILMAILFANLAILGGIALWRLAVRFVIPRFA
jgi:hypothetical protein